MGIIRIYSVLKSQSVAQYLKSFGTKNFKNYLIIPFFLEVLKLVEQLDSAQWSHTQESFNKKKLYVTEGSYEQKLVFFSKRLKKN